MGITPKFDMKGINKMLGQFQQTVENNAVRILTIVGEKCVNEARLSGNYQDRTANLRSSVGFIVVSEGRLYENGFNGEITKRKKDGSADMRYNSSKQEWSDGRQAGYRIANEIATQYPEGAALIVVSGMNYAVYVESKGYNVLTSAELLAEREVPNLLRQLR